MLRYKRSDTTDRCSRLVVTICAMLLANLMLIQRESTADTVRSMQQSGQGEGSDDDAEPSQPDSDVSVTPQAMDSQIQARLQRILDATDWYEDLEVTVDEGIVFLSATTDGDERKQWAGQLAERTQDVVAVVNRIESRQPSAWDFSSAWGEVISWFRTASQSLPYVLLAVVLGIVTWLATRLTKSAARRYLFTNLESTLLRNVSASALAIPVMVLGIYLILRIAGLTGLAATILGGTGLMGLVVGIAFRDIAENFLASVLISVERPFRIGDLITILEHKGFVQRVTTRGTLLMTFEGNHVQIPNATIYKNTVINYSTNPNVRLEFTIGIGYDTSVSAAQGLAREVLAEHPAVLGDPKPFVLVEELGAATINLTVYFWTDGGVNSHLKVRSSVIRMVKQAFEEAEISMPDEAREIVFPHGVPVIMDGESGAPQRVTTETQSHDKNASAEEAINPAEGGLQSELAELELQAENSHLPDDAVNLLDREHV